VDATALVGKSSCSQRLSSLESSLATASKALSIRTVSGHGAKTIAEEKPASHRASRVLDHRGDEIYRAVNHAAGSGRVGEQPRTGVANGDLHPQSALGFPERAEAKITSNQVYQMHITAAPSDGHLDTLRSRYRMVLLEVDAGEVLA